MTSKSRDLQNTWKVRHDIFSWRHDKTSSRRQKVCRDIKVCYDVKNCVMALKTFSLIRPPLSDMSIYAILFSPLF